MAIMRTTCDFALVIPVPALGSHREGKRALTESDEMLGQADGQDGFTRDGLLLPRKNALRISNPLSRIDSQCSRIMAPARWGKLSQWMTRRS